MFTGTCSLSWAWLRAGEGGDMVQLTRRPSTWSGALDAGYSELSGNPLQMMENPKWLTSTFRPVRQQRQQHTKSSREEGWWSSRLWAGSSAEPAPGSQHSAELERRHQLHLLHSGAPGSQHGGPSEAGPEDLSSPRVDPRSDPRVDPRSDNRLEPRFDSRVDHKSAPRVDHKAGPSVTGTDLHTTTLTP